LARRPNTPGATPSDLLKIQGTIPVLYNGAQYNIPMEIWLVEIYPLAPPVCMVTPTKDMIIKPRHKHVDSAGICYLPYISAWNPQSNIVSLIASLSRVFAEDPPVRALPPNQQPSTPAAPAAGPSPAPAPAASASPAPPPYSTSFGYNSSPAIASAAVPPYPYPPGSQSEPSLLSFQEAYEDPSVRRNNMVQNVTEKLQQKLRQSFQESTKDIEKLMDENDRLKQSLANSELSSLQQQMEQVEKETARVDAEIAEAKRWIEENEKTEVDVDAVTEPTNAAEKQLLHLVAEDLSYEDGFYVLNRALAAGSVDSATFLKLSRTLARDQFMARALIKKITDMNRDAAKPRPTGVPAPLPIITPPHSQQQLTEKSFVLM
jgi:ESCRT-I complex subunit TSG101